MNHGEMVRTETQGSFLFTLYVMPDFVDVRGNALSSGNDALDKECEDSILSRLDDGDTWAWASVCAECTHIPTGIVGVDYLGCCTYENTQDFLSDGYYEDMKSAALECCKEEMSRIKTVLNKESEVCR